MDWLNRIDVTPTSAELQTLNTLERPWENSTYFPVLNQSV